jgi:hypothetical protein
MASRKRTLLKVIILGDSGCVPAAIPPALDAPTTSRHFSVFQDFSPGGYARRGDAGAGFRSRARDRRRRVFASTRAPNGPALRTRARRTVPRRTPTDRPALPPTTFALTPAQNIPSDDARLR